MTMYNLTRGLDATLSRILGRTLARILECVPTALIVVALVVGILEWVPGDPLDALLGDQALPADRVVMAAALGLDQPFLHRYMNYTIGLFYGDWGQSLMNGKPVLALIVTRAPATLMLALAAMGFALAVGLVFGAALALSKGRARHGLEGLTQTLMVTPSFVLGPLLIAVLAVWLNLFPVAGMGGPNTLVLPAITLGTGMGMVLARFLGAQLRETYATDCLKCARAKGASPKRLFWRHALPLSAGPVLQIVFLQLGMVLTGAVLTEAVFGWPGLGALLVESLHQRDYPVLQGCLLVISITYMLCVVFSDITTRFIDPRLIKNNDL